MTSKAPTPADVDEIDAEKLAAQILKHASESANEADLVHRVESTLRPILEKWGIRWASYENRSEISGIRKDALYGTVIIEYKAPGKLDSKSEFNKVKEQVKKYIKEQAIDEKYFGRYFGVAIDGNKISFVRFRKNEWEEQAEPLEVNAQTILRLLESIRGLRRKPIDAESLLLDFGPKSELSRKTILSLYESIADKNTERTDMLFNDWKRVFSQVCSYSAGKLSGLIDYYGLTGSKGLDVEKLLYSIHTYYTILMKLLTSEIVTLFADSLLGSYLKRIEEAYYRSKEEMLRELRDLEEGGIFLQVGIKNFLEADYFGWYLDEWNDEIAASISELTKRLLDYEPATVELSPERVKDLFKRLYQNLVPRDIRHSLGEYFTPDWLAELLLDEAGYHGNPDKRLLDPACGSGTFLVLTIRRLKEYAEEHFLDRRELLKKVTDNVKGIDLNPLAVLASKANYLIALSELIRYRPREGIEIPVYLADSISVVRRVTVYGEDEFELNTNEGRFWVTKEVIDKNYLYPVLSVIAEGIKAEWTKEEFERYLSGKISLSKMSVQSFIRLYSKILNLEKFGKNKIWTSLLKNSFSPMLIGKFDYVIGNPPWINWENLPTFYRESTKWLWGTYDLLETSAGGIKRDIAMLFVARCLDLYLNKDGVLGFLMPFTVFKTKSARGFRRFLASRYKVLGAHDLVELYPFEGATNRTSLLVVGHGKSAFPVPCKMWLNPRHTSIGQETELSDVLRLTRNYDSILTPIDEKTPDSAWMIINQKTYEILKRVLKPSAYRAYAGTLTGMDGIYVVRILREEPDGVIIENLAKTAKKKLARITKKIEKELVYPVVRGRDCKRWYFEPELQIIVPHDDATSRVIEASRLRTDFPLTYQYLLSFKEILANRTIKPFLGTKKSSYPFYILDNIGKRTFSKYKVAWKHISGKISGKAVLEAFVISPTENNRTVIPTHGLIYVPTDNEDEAYYLCAILNSSIAHLIVMSYALEVHITTDVTNYVYIPDFDKGDAANIRLSQLSRKAHELAGRYRRQGDPVAQVELDKVEGEIDKTVAELYGITQGELRELERTLTILKEGEVEEEETAQEELVVPVVSDIDVKVEPLFILENEGTELKMTVSNNSGNTLVSLRIEVYFEGNLISSQEVKRISPNSSESIGFKPPMMRRGEHELKIVLYSSKGRSEEKRKLFVGAETRGKKARSILDQ